MAVPTWKKARERTGNAHLLPGGDKEGGGWQYCHMHRKPESYEEEKDCGYLRETFDSWCILKKFVPLHFYHTGFS